MEEQQIGSYKILRKIGAGGMAQVYLGVHKDVPNLKVVLKILSDRSLVERFKQEADKLALLDGNASICQIKHFFNHGDDMVIAMEFIEGESLDQKIKDGGIIPLAESLKIISDVLDTLEFAHQKGVFHRDIKPSNIMIDSAGRVKIIDFGIAKGKTDPNLTITGTSCGTPVYMAPEQFIPTVNTDYARVDIYAIGTTLYQMLTGECPFSGENEFALRDAKLFSEPVRPRALNPQISKTLEDVILKSIKKEPEERFATAQEMKDAIDDIRKTLGSVYDSETIAVQSKTPSKKKSKTLLAGGVLIAVVIVAVVIAYILKSPKGQEAKITTPTDTVTIKTEPPAQVQQPANPTGTIEFSIAPYGDVYLDDALEAAKTSHSTLTSDTGRHVIRVENQKALNKVIVETLSLAMGDQIQKNYRFKMPPQNVETAPVKPQADFGTLIVGSDPKGANIFIDGNYQERRQTPYSFKLTPGEHVIKITLNLDGKEMTRESSVKIVGDSTAKVNFDLGN